MERLFERLLLPVDRLLDLLLLPVDRLLDRLLRSVDLDLLLPLAVGERLRERFFLAGVRDLDLRALV